MLEVFHFDHVECRIVRFCRILSGIIFFQMKTILCLNFTCSSIFMYVTICSIPFRQNTATFVVSRLEQARLQQAKEDAANKLSRRTFALCASSMVRLPSRKRDNIEAHDTQTHTHTDTQGEKASMRWRTSMARPRPPPINGGPWI